MLSKMYKYSRCHGPEFSGKRREKECLVTKGNRAPNIVLIMADQLAPQFTGPTDTR